MNSILPEKESISFKKISKNRNSMLVAYYKHLGGTYDKDKKPKFQYETCSKTAKYLGVNEKTVRRAVSKLKDIEFDKIEPKNIDYEAAEIVKNYKSHKNRGLSDSFLIDAIIGLRNLGFSCRRIVELLKLEEDFDSRTQKARCPHCGMTNTLKHGGKNEKQKYLCKDCDKYFFEGAKFYPDLTKEINQRRKITNQITYKSEEKAFRYLNSVLLTKESISFKKVSKNRSSIFVAYYKHLKGTRKDGGWKFQQKKYKKVAEYLGANEKTVYKAVSKLKDTEFDKIKPRNIKDVAAKIVRNYESHGNKNSSSPSLIDVIIGLRDLGFSYCRIVELLKLEENFNSKQGNENNLELLANVAADQEYLPTFEEN